MGITSSLDLPGVHRARGHRVGSDDVLSEPLAPDDSAFAARGQGVQVTAGHTYRIAIRTETSSTLGLGLINGDIDARFDNVALTVQTGGRSTPGGEFPVGTPGVTIVNSSLSSSEIARLIERFGIKADVGKGPGGSRIPLASCTVVGTPGADRILGSRLQARHRTPRRPRSRSRAAALGSPADRARRGGSGALSPAIRSSGAEFPSEGSAFGVSTPVEGVDGRVPCGERSRIRSGPEGSSLKRSRSCVTDKPGRSRRLAGTPEGPFSKAGARST